MIFNWYVNRVLTRCKQTFPCSIPSMASISLTLDPSFSANLGLCWQASYTTYKEAEDIDHAITYGHAYSKTDIP